jgi:acetyl esterase/lipase
MTRFTVLLLVLFAVTSVQAAAPPVRSAIRETLDVRYYPGDGGRHTLDVFAPLDASKRYPVVLFVHGGTWVMGDKNFFGLNRGVGRCLAKNGIVAVLINYRLSPAVKHPEHARDVARAFAWTCRNIAKYSGDPERIILAGHSAGAHLACLIAMDRGYLHDPALGLTDRDRAGLCGVASVSGVYRIPAPEELRKMMSRIVEILVERSAPEGLTGILTPILKRAGESFNPFAVVFGKDREVQTKASPLTHVRKGLPPFLVLCAESEIPGLEPMAEDFVAALRKAGDSVTMKVVPGCTHRTILKQLHRADHEAGKLLLEFVQRCARLKPERPASRAVKVAGES